MLEQGSTTTKADILAVMEDQIKAIESLILDGKRVELGGLVILYPKIKGVFSNVNDTYTPARHQIDAGATAGIRLKNRLKSDARLEKVETVKPKPSLVQFKDWGSNEVNGMLTINNIGSITGHRLKYNAENDDEGIFFIKTDDNTETKVTVVQKNKPGELVFLIPGSLTAGTYNLEVRVRISNGTEIRQSMLDDVLTVS